jgi:ligand-binding SRPBCC domain-containing protein
MALDTRRSTIAATPAELFLFHQNPHNLRLLPVGRQILEIRAEETASPGREFALTIRQGPLHLSWVGRWERVEPPHLLLDVGVRCPFALWRHEHRFEEAADGALLTDRIEFRLPWHRGGPAGDWVAQKTVFPRMFAARHEATGRFFAGRGSRL